jgi:predicted ATP-grasp superfamily ATP-dependent carboligase
MRDALVADLAELDGVTVTFATCRSDTVRPEATPRRSHCMPEPGEPPEVFVARLARAHDYAWIIAPECDGLLASLHDAVGATRWLGCDAVALRLTSSKRQTAARLAAHGIEVTPALVPDHGPGDTGDSRWIVKPDDGAGGLDTVVFAHFADARAAYRERLAAGRNPVLQQWVDGDALSLSLLCGAGHAELLSINRQRIVLGSGAGKRIVEFAGVDVNQIERDSESGQALASLAARVWRALPGLRGFVGIDVVWHPRRGPVVIEVNPRLTVAYAHLSAALRRNIARDLLAGFGIACERARGEMHP